MQRPMNPPVLQKLPPKPPLVTPSASPPPVRHVFPRLSRPAESVPPSTRRRSRAASTPRPQQNQASSSRQSVPEEPLDFHKERQASTLRLLDVWSQLAERYTRRLDEDDIVDIVTGKIIKDNGVLRGSRTMKFGDNQAPAKGDALEGTEDEAEEDEGEEEDDEEDDGDELDAFADIDDLGGILDIQGPDMPPVTPQDPRDAEDLKHFLEIEQLRKETLGSEPEDDPEDASIPEDEGTDLTGGSEFSDIYDVTDEADGSVIEGQVVGETEDENQTASVSNELPEESDSEDELNFNFDGEDEASIVIPVAQTVKDQQDDDDDEIEIIEPPLPLKKPPATYMNSDTSNMRKNPVTSNSHLQLNTPPLSRTSVPPPLPTPSDHYSTTPPPNDPPVTDISPEIPLAHSISSLKPFSVNPESPKVKKTTSIPQLHLSRTSIRAKPERESISDLEVGGRRRFKPEVVITKRTPFSTPVVESASTSNKTDTRQAKQPLQRSKSSAPQLPLSQAKGKRAASVAGHTSSVSADKPSPEASHQEPQELHEEIYDPVIVSSPVPRPPKSSASTVVKKRSDIKPVASSSRSQTKAQSSHSIFPKISNPPDLQPSRAESSSVSPRKRKRSVPRFEDDEPTHGNGDIPAKTASSSKSNVHDVVDDHWSEPEPVGRSKDARRTIHQRSPRKRRSKSRSRPPESDSESESGSDADHTDRRRHRYQHAHPSAIYPYSQPLYPVPQHLPPRGFAPMPDAQTQYIVSQVMHHLTSFAASHWNAAPPMHHPHAPPYTPLHHRAEGEYAYSTPTHHHHPYPYAYNPELSRATLPPDTPEHDFSSSPAERGDGTRKKTLVERSRSRGRRVSFQAERSPEIDQDDEDDEMDVFSSPSSRRTASGDSSLHGMRIFQDEDYEQQASASSSSRRRNSLPPAKPRPPDRDKGKGRAKAPDSEGGEEGDMSDHGPHDSERERDVPRRSPRGRHMSRAQTPGPSTSVSRSGSGSVKKHSVVSAQRSRSTSAHPARHR